MNDANQGQTTADTKAELTQLAARIYNGSVFGPDPRTEENVRTRIAIALLPFTTPKLGVTYNASEADFATLLEERIKRHQSKLIGKEAKLIQHLDKPPLAKVPFARRI